MTLRINNFQQYEVAYKKSVEDPEGFWEEQAKTFQWQQPWQEVVKWEFETPSVQWFLGGKLNITENCLDRHLADRGDQVAILWEPNDPTQPTQNITYRQLHAEVCKTANALKANGIGKGDRVCFYMPMVPELAIGVL